MQRSAWLTVVVLLAPGCHGDDELDGVTEECILDTIVKASVEGGSIDCSPPSVATTDIEGALPYYLIETGPDESSVVPCMSAALHRRRASVYVSQLYLGIDSYFRTAKLVSSNGKATFLSFDSSPEGQGSGSNTIFRFGCASFRESPNLGCDDQSAEDLVCSQSRRTRLMYGLERP